MVKVGSPSSGCCYGEPYYFTANNIKQACDFSCYKGEPGPGDTRVTKTTTHINHYYCSLFVSFSCMFIYAAINGPAEALSQGPITVE